jgi:hypothetical protein
MTNHKNSRIANHLCCLGYYIRADVFQAAKIYSD